MQKVVAIDVGNSSMKVAVGSKENLVRIPVHLSVEERSQQLMRATKDLTLPTKWQVCSVDRRQTDWLESWASKHRPDDSFHTIAADEIQLDSIVEDRNALGRDRLLGAWYGAARTTPGNPSIVVDAGTAVTIDVVVPDQGHLGGLIFPGTHACLAAVSDQTDALPDLTKAEQPKLKSEVQLGTSTEPAILLGVHQAQLFGVVAMVRSLEKQYPNAQVWCCGGALESVHSLLPEAWHYDRDFLIEAIFHLEGQ